MKKTVFLAAAVCLLFAVSAFAQSKTDFSGNWTLDVGKSKIKNVESGSMTVTQTDKDITYKSEIKRAPRPEGAGGGNGGAMAQGNGGGGGRGMGGGRGGMGGGSQTMTYTLDGKETSMEMPGPQGMTTTAKLKSKWDGDKLKLTSTRSFDTPNGEMTVFVKDTWEMVDGGKVLKVTRETESPRGSQTSEFYYTKN
ncbi:MAG: hypothetical protein ACR2L1_00080 [Pyrinomonadaceae bacterium]